MSGADTAELSSMATAVAELASRVAGMAERYIDTPRDDLATRLYDAERSLSHASRTIEQLVRDLG